MTNKYTAVIRKDGDWWIGWVEEVSGVNAQEATKSELIESLKEALSDILELNREQARNQMEGEFEEIAITA